MLQPKVHQRGGPGVRKPATLSGLRSGETAILERLDLPQDVAKRLMELGFVPGQRVEPAQSAPGGEPRVYRVDGSEVALRRETAEHIFVTGRAGVISR